MNLPPYSHAQEYADHTRLMRWISNSMRLPTLCRHTPCYRARKCRRNPRECITRFAPLVPEDARDWMAAVADPENAEREFEDLRAEHPEAFEAMVAWHEALEHARGKG